MGHHPRETSGDPMSKTSTNQRMCPRPTPRLAGHGQSVSPINGKGTTDDLNNLHSTRGRLNFEAGVRSLKESHPAEQFGGLLAAGATRENPRPGCPFDLAPGHDEAAGNVPLPTPDGTAGEDDATFQAI